MVTRKKKTAKKKVAKRKPARKAAAKKRVVKKKAVKKVRCSGKTKDGKRCKRTVALPAKTCHLHRRKRK